MKTTDIRSRIDEARQKIVYFERKAADARKNGLAGFGQLYDTLADSNRRRVRRLAKLARAR